MIIKLVINTLRIHRKLNCQIKLGRRQDPYFTQHDNVFLQGAEMWWYKLSLNISERSKTVKYLKLYIPISYGTTQNLLWTEVNQLLLRLPSFNFETPSKTFTIISMKHVWAWEVWQVMLGPINIIDSLVCCYHGGCT